MSSESIRERTRQQFIQAARQLTLLEGADAVSVRKIGELTGTSYATIYNYFSDRNHLLWHVSMSFITEIVSLFSPVLEQESLTVPDVCDVYQRYAGYFLANPQVFGLLFFNQIGPAPEEFGNVTAEPRFARELVTRLNPGSSSRSPAENEDRAAVLTSCIQGKLLMYLCGKSDSSRESFLQDIRHMTEFILSQ